ncbi:MAG: tetratricopeptide repeat protein [Reyranella sp.]|uniref:tetratricopeptide repeat protein n=1 Tax=Reyranella sp. TaxID=1929291 RepID=UPI001AC23DDF|nr:tetratricopeptide repeat protein [Reyranella sp.]MBN9086699.1 tetratricopeptide repeat protein [Reyranella sp.]
MAREQRRLVAIVAADVVGYSRLMGRDEAGTVARLHRVREQHLIPLLARRGGRIVKLMGDGAILEFGSAVEAVGAAVEFQQAMTAADPDLPPADALTYRLGVHLGDLIVDGDDLYGDGINVAARLEAKAPTGGILVSGAVHEAVTGRLKVSFEDLGLLALKNIDRPVHAFSVKWEQADWQQLSCRSPEPSVRRASDSAPRPSAPKEGAEQVHSILVLPFSSVGGDPEQQDLAEAITDDLTHDLSRIPGTLVIAQGTAATLKGQSIDARAAAREFGVRYVIDGRVRISADRIRVSVQLVDAETGGQVWSDRIDAARIELAELQDTISGRIAWALELELPSVESKRSQSGASQSPDAFELSMLGWSLMNRAPSRENVLAAQEHFQQARDLDPRSLSARIGLSFVFVRKVVSYWSAEPQDDLARSKELIEPALIEAPKHDRGHFIKGLILRTEVQPELSSVFFERAIEINPNYAQAIAFLGFNQILVGRPEQTFRLVERAIRLSPRDPQLGVWLGFVSTAHVLLQQFEQAVEVAARAVAANPEYGIAHLRLAMACAMAGRLDDAKVALADVMRLLPDASVGSLRARRIVSRNLAYVASQERAYAVLQAIGLPE